MMKIVFSILLIIIAGSYIVNAQNYVPEQQQPKIKVKPVVNIKAYSFNLADVQLLDGPFKTAMEAEAKYLRMLEPDRFLADFREHAGLKAKGERYGGWESSGLAGHSLGHYLSACAMHYATSRDTHFLNKVNYIVDELAECSPKRNGYLGAIPKEDSMWAEVAKGNIRSRGFDLNGAWSPWYTVHKIMAGLLDAYLYCDNKKALDLQVHFSDWTANTLKDLNDSLLEKMRYCEYGGMNEALVNTWALTGNKKYLDLSYKFHDHFVLDSLAAQKNVLPGKHSNTQIPKVIGCIRRHELTGETKDRNIADFFWHTVINKHTYAPGGNSNYEYFGPENALNETLTDNTMETCNTYNMLKLTRHLFALQPSAQLMNYYERGLYNHILASQHHESGMVCYFVPLRMGTRKNFSNPYFSFTCCVGSGMENHVKYGESIYYKGADGGLYVNLFIPSQLNWKEKGITVTQQTALPANDNVTLTINTKKSSSFPLYIRKPKWAGDNIRITVNGIQLKNAAPDKSGYFIIKRKWNDGDKIELTIPMGLYTRAMPDNPGRVAFFYGPVILAGVFGDKEPDPVTGIPVLVSAENNASQWLKADGEQSLVFHSANIGKPKDITFKPFHQVQDEYYSVYLDVFTPQGWAAQQKIYEAEKKRLRDIEERTVDVLRLGEMQPERDHDFTGEEARTGENHGKKYRMTGREGQFTFVMNVDPEKQNTLMCTYWGMDNRGRIFDIYVNDVLIATEDINKYKASKFYDITYPIPQELTRGKSTVTVKFKAKPNNMVGPVYGDVRMMRGVL